MMCPILGMFLVLTSASGDAKPKAGAYAKPDLLVEASGLRQSAAAERFRILDARGRQKYLGGHILGAVWVDHAAWSKAFSESQDQTAWSRRIGAVGIDVDTPVVIYDDNSMKDASRIWWILRYWGIRDVRLLNGGWAAWQVAGGKSVTREESLDAGTPKLRPQRERLTTKDQLLADLKNHSVQIIDARSAGEHCGLEQTARRNGAIPGAVNLEWSELIDKQSQRFKSADELAKLLRDRGIDLEHPAVTHCQSGGRSSVMAFALELMGAKQVGNYYRSWAEWGNAEDTPIVKPETKK
jgi:thiosulfate/3-mercaptopyruvate sulfurtransferase